MCISPNIVISAYMFCFYTHAYTISLFMAFYNVQIYFASDKSDSLHDGFDLGLQMNSLIFEQHRERDRFLPKAKKKKKRECFREPDRPCQKLSDSNIFSLFSENKNSKIEKRSCFSMFFKYRTGKRIKNVELSFN